MLRFSCLLILPLLLFACRGTEPLASDQEIDPEIKKSLRYLERSLRLDPHHGPTYRERAQIYTDLEKYDLALRDYNLALQHKDSSHETLYQRGLLLLELNRPQEAKQDFEKALLRDPKHSPTLNYLGYYLLQDQSFLQALQLLNLAVENDSSLLNAYVNRGSAHYFLGQLDEAIGDFRFVLSQRPDHPVALSNLGLALSTQGHIQEGRMHLDRALDLDPQLAEAWYNRGLARYAQGEREKAEEDFRQAKALKPELVIRIGGGIWEP